MKNIFICYTPLHLLIARKLILSKRLSNCRLIFISFNLSEKNRYYFDKVKLNFSQSDFITIKKNSACGLLKLAALVVLKGRSGDVYSGNIKHFYTRYVAFILGMNELYTYDDGIGNIVRDAYFEKKEESSLGRLFFSILSKKYCYGAFVKKIKIHYTIFDTENVYRPVEKIDLFSKFDRKKPIGKINRVTVYLSNNFAEDSIIKQQEERILDSKIIRQFNIDLVLMHPRTTVHHRYDGEPVKTVETQLIAEDYIRELCKHYHVRVVGVNSTALITMSTIDGVELINCTTKPLNVESSVGGLFSKYGIVTYDIEI